MPYRRKSTYRRRPRASKSTRNVAYRALKLAKLNYQVTERKAIDYQVSSTQVSQSGNVFNICAIAQGQQPYDRIGDEVNASTIVSRIRFTPGSAQENTVLVRAMFFHDREDRHGVDPTLSDVLQLAPGGINAMMNTYANGRFQILYDRVFKVTPFQGNNSDRQTGQDLSVHQLQFYRKLNPVSHKISYDSASAGDYTKGGLFFVCFCDTVVSGVNTPVFSGVNRLWYIDK